MTPEIPILSPNQHYDITLHLHVPESHPNYDLGNFMIQLTLYDFDNNTLLSSKRPGILRHKSPLARFLTTIWKAPFIVTGWMTESQQLSITLVSNLLTRTGPNSLPSKADISLYSHPSWTLGATISGLGGQPYNPSLYANALPPLPLQIYSSTLQISAHFHGLAYFMYYWFISTATIGIAVIVGWEAIIGYIFLRLFWNSTESRETSESLNRRLRRPRHGRHDDVDGARPLSGYLDGEEGRLPTPPESESGTPTTAGDETTPSTPTPSSMTGLVNSEIPKEDTSGDDEVETVSVTHSSHSNSMSLGDSFSSQFPPTGSDFNFTYPRESFNPYEYDPSITPPTESFSDARPSSTYSTNEIRDALVELQRRRTRARLSEMRGQREEAERSISDHEELKSDELIDFKIASSADVGIVVDPDDTRSETSTSTVGLKTVGRRDVETARFESDVDEEMYEIGDLRQGNLPGDLFSDPLLGDEYDLVSDEDASPVSGTPFQDDLDVEFEDQQDFDDREGDDETEGDGPSVFGTPKIMPMSIVTPENEGEGKEFGVGPEMSSPMPFEREERDSLVRVPDMVLGASAYDEDTPDPVESHSTRRRKKKAKK